MHNDVRRRVLVWTLLFAAAFCLRLAFISKGAFHSDALDLAMSSEKTLQTFRLQYEHGTGYPLTVLFGALFIAVFRLFGAQDAVFCVNVMSAFFGAAGVVLLYLLAERLFDARRAASAALLMIFFSSHLAISTFGKSLTISICFVLASAWFCLRYSRDARRPDLFFAAVFLGFCAASRLSDAVAAVPLVFLLCVRRAPWRDRARDIVVFGVLSMATTALYYVPMLMENGVAPFVSVITHKNEAAFLGFFSPVLRYSFRLLQEAFKPEGIVVILAGAGLMLIHRRVTALVFLAIWFLTFQFFYGNISSSGTRYLVIGWLPLVLAQGYFFGGWKGKASLAADVLLVLVVAAGVLRVYPVLEFRHQHDMQGDYARWVASLTGPEDAVIAIDEAPFIWYYAKRDTISWQAECDDASVDAFFREKVDGTLRKRHRVFLMGTSFSYDHCGKIKKRLDRDYTLVPIGRKLNEDWHHALLNQTIMNERLWEVRTKT